jgi:eukaryotic-like serine/threonine-protein kinase
MTPEQWKQLDDLFEEASPLPESEWDGFARDRCADEGIRKELISLLRAQESAGALLDAPLASVGTLVDGETDGRDAMIGARVGAFTIESVLGRGGMGVVYRARQDSPSRTVALKVVNPGAVGAASLRRFQRETEALGRLQHPGVAQIYESGHSRTPLGLQPYFAMELVDGRPLLDYAAAKNLSIRERLELMARICDAVQFAHVKGIIHRDLKPGNILVDELGQPKILDFGIARLTDSDIRATTIQTNIGQLIGTIPYMSPEQAAGDPRELDLRSDVYALGVVLFELLAGRLPYELKQRPVTEAVRIVTEQDPTRLSSISRTFRGDIETIVGKALEKDKSRRYQSAAELASDIRRHLADQAIIARPASTAYHLRKFARRNKALVGGVICAFILLVAGVIGTSIGLVRAIDAEKRALVDAVKAKREAHNANEATTFLQGMLNAANPDSGNRRDLTVRELLMQASVDLDAQLMEEPEVRAAVHYTIGSAFAGMQDFGPAAEHLNKSLELRTKAYGPADWRVANCIHKLASIEYYSGNRDKGLKEVRRGIDIISADPEALWEDVAIQHLDLAQMLNGVGKHGEAEGFARKAIDIARTAGGPRHIVTASATSALAGVFINQGKYALAEPLILEALDICKEKFGAHSPRVATYQIELGKTLMNLSREAEAEEPLAAAVETRRSVFHPDHPKVAIPLDQLAQAQMTGKKFVAAESNARESLRIRRSALGDDNAETVSSMIVLCRILVRQNKLEDAEPLARQALDVRLRLLGEDDKLTAQSMEALGNLLIRKKSYDEARRVYTRALEVRRRVLGPRHVLVSNALRGLGSVNAEQGDHAASAAHYEEAVSLLDEAFDDDHAVLAAVRLLWANQLSVLERWNDAEAAYRAALAGMVKRNGEKGKEVADCLAGLARTLKARGDEAAAQAMTDRAARAREAPAGAVERNTE